MREVKVYSTDMCTLCNSVENLLNARDIPYEKILLHEDSSEYDELVERTGMQTMPQVFIGSMLLGGFQETMAADQSGMLADLLVD
ncbi:MAG: glutaredoxin 3 [Solirubrobacteraceae bacterium]|jgi:glutaredoxin 3|nr:glutaredoxin 3 [Solirubrobacteraceae bacterium]